MTIIQKIKNSFRKTPKKPTLDEALKQLNIGYKFNQFEKSLVDVVYTTLLDYGTVSVETVDKYKYIITLVETNCVNCDAKVYELNEDGLNIYIPVLEDLGSM